MCVCSRFDLEQNQAEAEVQRERGQREKLARERDAMTGEMFNLRQQLQVSYFTEGPSDILSRGRHVWSLCSLYDITGLVQMCTLLCLFLLQDKDTELCAVNMKVQQLEAELQDLSSQESKDEASLAKTKKQLRDLEAKVKDQEEELDEQAGTIQMLEQVRGGGGADMVNLPTMEKVFPAKSCLYNDFHLDRYKSHFSRTPNILTFFVFVYF